MKAVIDALVILSCGYWVLMAAIIHPAVRWYVSAGRRPFKGYAALCSGAGWAKTIAMGGLIVALTNAYAAKIITVPSPSMVPALAVGGSYMVSPLSRALPFVPFFDGTPDLALGQVVVARFPYSEDVLYVKRLLGGPGDRVHCDGHALVINDKRYPLVFRGQHHYPGAGKDKEVAAHRFDQYSIDIEGRVFNVIIPSDQPIPVWSRDSNDLSGYFMVGDNWTNSLDSRQLGSIPSLFLDSVELFPL